MGQQGESSPQAALGFRISGRLGYERHYRYIPSCWAFRTPQIQRGSMLWAGCPSPLGQGGFFFYKRMAVSKQVVHRFSSLFNTLDSSKLYTVTLKEERHRKPKSVETAAIRPSPETI